MERKIVIATMNDHKVREIKSLIGDRYNVLTQDYFSIPSVPETGTTFEENALIKANQVAEKTDLLTLADDSGLEVDLLNGEPGIYSSRYAGPNATDDENNQKLIKELESYKGEKMTARFHSVIAIVEPSQNKQRIFHGTWEGRIKLDQKGKNGFGYDPLFYIDDLGATAAELTELQKNRLSHRASAMRAAINYLVRKTEYIK
tara:strand:- start:476 stop:1081 length:606 start_codon:yes stop_codon:yes gene_type:complete